MTRSESQGHSLKPPDSSSPQRAPKSLGVLESLTLRIENRELSGEDPLNLPLGGPLETPAGGAVLTSSYVFTILIRKKDSRGMEREGSSFKTTLDYRLSYSG